MFGFYTVQPGDTLIGIARQYATSLAALLSINPQYQTNPDLIHPGDRVRLPGVPSVYEFGGVGDGVADDTDALQAWLDDALVGGDDPASAVRRLSHRFDLPAGRWRTTRPIRVESVQGLHLHGAGSGVTFLQPDGEFDAVLDLDGLAYSTIGGFTIASPSGRVDSAIRLDWSEDAARSTSAVRFDDIFVRNTPLRAAFSIGTRFPTRQVSEVVFRDCIAKGHLPENQVGFELGNGVASNVLALDMDECHSTGWGRGVSWDATNGQWRGGSIGGNGTDFYLTGAVSTVSIDQVRSEDSSKFLDGPGVSGAAGTVAVSNVDFHCNALEAPYTFIEHGLSGVLTLTNVRASDDEGKLPRVEFQNGKDLAVNMIGCGSRSPFGEFLFDNAPGRVVVTSIGYCETDGSDEGRAAVAGLQEVTL